MMTLKPNANYQTEIAMYVGRYLQMMNLFLLSCKLFQCYQVSIRTKEVLKQISHCVVYARRRRRKS